ncbi:MAG: hypothetical protein ACYDHF_06180 [Candidatus Cryosericum sp.]
MKAFTTWWREFWKWDPGTVNQATVLAAAFGVLLAAPVQGLCFAAVYQHVWILKKGLDGPTVNLLIAMLTAATGSLGLPMFSKSIGPPPGWHPPALEKEK